MLHPGVAHSGGSFTLLHSNSVVDDKVVAAVVFAPMGVHVPQSTRHVVRRNEANISWPGLEFALDMQSCFPHPGAAHTAGSCTPLQLDCTSVELEVTGAGGTVYTVFKGKRAHVPHSTGHTV